MNFTQQDKVLKIKTIVCVCVDEVDGSEKHKKILPKKKETKLRDLTGASVRPEKKR